MLKIFDLHVPPILEEELQDVLHEAEFEFLSIFAALVAINPSNTFLIAIEEYIQSMPLGINVDQFVSLCIFNWELVHMFNKTNYDLRSKVHLKVLLVSSFTFKVLH